MVFDVSERRMEEGARFHDHVRPPARHFYASAKKETDLVSNLDRVDKWNGRDPQNGGNGQGSQAPKVHDCIRHTAASDL